MNKGDIVTIHNAAMSGKPAIEGRAKLIRQLREPGGLAEGRGYWEVQFVGDAPDETYFRWVEEKPCKP